MPEVFKIGNNKKNEACLPRLFATLEEIWEARYFVTTVPVKSIPKVKMHQKT